jgi:MFS family permease
MGGRLAWGPISDRVGAGTTLALFGLSVPSLLLCPAATGMVPTDPHTALLLFRAGAVGTLFCFAGAPVMIAPAAAELFGHQAAGQIYRRLWITVPVANVVANLLVTRVRALPPLGPALCSRYCTTNPPPYPTPPVTASPFHVVLGASVKAWTSTLPHPTHPLRLPTTTTTRNHPLPLPPQWSQSHPTHPCSCSAASS